MITLLRAIYIPLLSLFIFVLGSGLFNTLLTVNLHHQQATEIMIGLMTGTYYAGLAYGSFKIEAFILRAGHIRAFAAFASCVSIVSLLQGMFFQSIFWVVLRFVGGFATAGVFVVIESWLLAVGAVKQRGQILAFYMVALYAAQALGQLLINITSAQTLVLFAVTAILSALSVIPLSLTKTPVPELTSPSTLRLKKLFRISGSGLLSSFCAGLILGALYGLLPLFILMEGEGTMNVSLFMALLIFGGMFLQYPVGKLSDSIERRVVLLGLSVFTIFIAPLFMITVHVALLKYLMYFILGGVTFTFYPVSISLTCDRLNQEDIVAGTQSILLIYSIGATIGPLLAPIFIHLFGAKGLFIYLMTITLLLSLFLGWRKIYVSSQPQEEEFRVMPQTTPVISELDPRNQMTQS